LLIIKTPHANKLKNFLTKNQIEHQIIYNEPLTAKKPAKKDKLRAYIEAKSSKHPKPSIVYPREVYLFRTSRKETEGTEAMKTRPGIVISVEGLNKWNKRCIMVPATTKKTELAKIYPFEVKVVIEGKKGKAMIDQIKTYSLDQIILPMGKITEKELETIQKKNHVGL
ncbi:7590_t:CDS:2, partial [Entrophospora sp. SA101]